MYVSGAERTVDKELWVDTSFPFFFEKTQIMMQYPEASWKSDAFYSIYSKEVS